LWYHALVDLLEKTEVSMNEVGKRLVRPDLGSFHDNWCQFPAEQLSAYYGRYVAWSLDGTRILASGATEEELEKRLIGLGISPSQIVGEFIEPPETHQG
jgi:hypothetical protein